MNQVPPDGRHVPDLGVGHPPRFIMTTQAFLDENPRPTEAEIREALSGNICRCTGYVKIVEAILAASGQEVKHAHH